MKPQNKSDQSKLRIRLMLGFLLAIQGGILIFLWNLQVVQGHTFEETIHKQSLRRIRHPGSRGRIFDRNGIALADNRPSISVALYFEELRVPGRSSKTIDRIEKMLDEVSAQIEVPRKLTRKTIENHYHTKRLLPLIAWEDLDDSTLARWAERVGPQVGMDLLTEPVRTYPYGDLLAQTIGYVGRGGMGGSEEETYDFYINEMEGKAGLELVLDEKLRGEAGGELVRIDAASYRYNLEAEKPSVPGQDVRLTIDAKIQRLCERILDEETGSMVVIDPRNGEVLAMATNPRYDLNDMTPFISHTVWNRLRQDPRKPMINRPVREQYPPGSIIKPAVCLAGLAAGVDPATVFNCEGVYYAAPGASPMHCHNRLGHGPINMTQAIERSCNVYMWKLAEEIGYDPVYDLLENIGIGQKTGIEVDYEVPGILPTDAWKKRHYNDVLRKGDIANLVIGQGFLNVTPLQMARMTATLANGGTLVSPTLIQGFRHPELSQEVIPIAEDPGFISPEDPNPARNLGWDPQKVEAIRVGMRDVVMSPQGTARRAQVEGLVYAGKTGTAQYGSPGNRRYRSWMIAFAPYDNPTIAAVVLIDAGQGSGIDASPRMKLLMQALFGRTNRG
ncbi:penicillin-binding protein 2 [Kiritimatiellaeota bacterium B1221]|nr:penicillin-binding protein 2 [Kiritimatiellaeota bacterium B1221]